MLNKNYQIGFVTMIVTFLLCAFLSIEHESEQTVIITASTPISHPPPPKPNANPNTEDDNMKDGSTTSFISDHDQSTVHIAEIPADVVETTRVHVIVEENDDPPISDFDERYDGKFIHNQWKCHFHQFISTKLHHSISDGFISKCKSVDPYDIGALITMTDSYLDQQPISIDRNDRNSYHDLISLRRIIMLLQSHSIETVPNDFYMKILNKIATKEQVYFRQARNHFPVFNIHPPRSAGTTMCGWFRAAKNNQNRLSDEQKEKQTKIRMNPEPQRNCNIMPDGM